MENVSELIDISFEVEFRIGDLVYIVTDKEQDPKMIDGYVYNGPRNEVLYILVSGTYTIDKYFYSRELSKERNVILTSTN